jgi:O-antigen/teichoic acid export membrane protein
MLDRLKNQDWSFLRSSTLMSLGLAAARLLGFLFWLVLARMFEKSDTGHVRYIITLGELLAIGTIPFSQHVLAWFISRYRSDEAYLRRVMGTAWQVLLVLTGATLLAATVVLLALDRFDASILVVFLGVTLFYAYYGLARGHLAQGRLLAAYVGSNLIQIIAVGIAVVTLGTQSTTPILLIYGTSYLLPILLLQARHPLPLHVSWGPPDREVGGALLSFAGPIWISHTLYACFMAIDILLLEYFVDKAAVGVYAVTRTVASLLGLIPWAIDIMLMPRIAASDPSEHRRMLRNALLLILVANAVALICFLVGYQWFIETTVGRDYYAGMDFGLVMAVGAILFGLFGIFSSVLVGRRQPGLEAVGRFVTLVVTAAAGLVLVPPADPLGVSQLVTQWLGLRSTGIHGMALASLMGVGAGLVAYALLAGPAPPPAGGEEAAPADAGPITRGG